MPRFSPGLRLLPPAPELTGPAGEAGAGGAEEAANEGVRFADASSRILGAQQTIIRKNGCLERKEMLEFTLSL